MTIEHSEPTVTPVTDVRITPTGPDGTPDHDDAFTYRLREPVWFAYVHRTDPAPFITEPITRGHTLSPLVALLAPDGHPNRETLRLLSEFIWQHRTTTVAVDLWSGSAGPRYLLIPRWRCFDISDDPIVELPHHRTWAVGEAVQGGQPMEWPRLDPAQAAYTLQAGVSMLLTTEIDPPPPAGFTAARLRRGLENDS